MYVRSNSAQLSNLYCCNAYTATVANSGTESLPYMALAKKQE